MCVCLSVRDHIFRTARPIFIKFLMHVANGRGSVLLTRVVLEKGPLSGCVCARVVPAVPTNYCIQHGATHSQTLFNTGNRSSDWRLNNWSCICLINLCWSHVCNWCYDIPLNDWTHRSNQYTLGYTPKNRAMPLMDIDIKRHSDPYSLSWRNLMPNLSLISMQSKTITKIQ